MDTVDLQEAARMLHRSEKTLRRWILKTKTLPAQMVHGRYRIATSDIERLSATLPSDDERIVTLEHRISQLEDRLGVLEHLYSLEHKTSPQPLQAQKQAHKGEGLPDGFVPIYDLIKEHNLLSKRNAIMRHMQPYLKKGAWNVGGHEVKNALDHEGQAEFRRRYVTPVPRS